MEAGGDGREVPLQCTALWIDQRRVFLIRRVPLDVYEAQYHVFQSARRARLNHTAELAHSHEQLDLEVAERQRAEEALRRNEAEFRIIFENAAIGMALLDDSGHPVRSNRALQSMLGYSDEELHAIKLADVTHPDDDAADLSFYREMVDGKRDQYQLKKRYVRKDRKRCWARLSVTALRNRNGRLQYCVAMVEDITQQELAEHSLRQLTGRLIKAQEEERSRIARELHDDLNQRLGLLAIELGQLHNRLLESDPEVTQRIDRVWQETNDLSEDVHRLSHNLHSSLLENLGLVPALRNLCTEFREQHGIGVEFGERDVPSDLSSEIALCLFRIAQECLSNIAKHSRARLARVCLDGTDAGIRLLVEDDGVGFDLDARQGKPGLGIVSIRERLRLVKGSISIRSSPATGTRIEVCVPLAGVGTGRLDDGAFESAAM